MAVNMVVRRLESNRARANWGQVQDVVVRGEADIVVERYGRPSVAMIPFEDFMSLRDDIFKLRAARKAATYHKEWEENPSQAMPYEDFRAELVTQGLLDE